MHMHIIRTNSGIPTCTRLPSCRRNDPYCTTTSTYTRVHKHAWISVSTATTILYGLCMNRGLIVTGVGGCKGVTITVGVSDMSVQFDWLKA